jgi:hypothetical protein
MLETNVDYKDKRRKFLWRFGTFLLDYALAHPRRCDIYNIAVRNPILTYYFVFHLKAKNLVSCQVMWCSLFQLSLQRAGELSSLHLERKLGTYSCRSPLFWWVRDIIKIFIVRKYPETVHFSTTLWTSYNWTYMSLRSSILDYLLHGAESGDQLVSSILWNPKVHCRIHKCPLSLG